MKYYLIRFGDTSNPVDLVDENELVQIEKNAEEFDGFSGIVILKTLTEAEALDYKTF